MFKQTQAQGFVYGLSEQGPGKIITAQGCQGLGHRFEVGLVTLPHSRQRLGGQVGPVQRGRGEQEGQIGGERTGR